MTNTNTHKRKTAFWVSLAVASLLVNAYLLYPKTASDDQKSEIGNQKSDLYVCPMHPQVVSDHPADCPICGMKLVKRQSGGESDAEVDSLIGTVKFSPTQELLANVAVEHPQMAHFGEALTLPGTIREVEGSGWKASSRVMGRIEKLFVSNSGQAVKEGDPLFELYSPDIAAAAREFLYVRKNTWDDTTGEVLEAARGKLLSLGLDFKHLQEIERLNEPFDIYTFNAPRSGVLMSKMVSEGEWAMPGMVILDFLDLSEVWIEGSLYERDAGKVRVGTEVSVISPSGEKGVGRVTLLGPMADMMSRTIPFRATLANPGRVWTPGTFVTVDVGSREGMEALSLPEDAVIHTGRGTFVWALVDEGRYASREVVTGPHINGRIAIMEGLTEADAVAVTGAYLIDSDAQIKSIGSGHQHGAKKESGTVQAESPEHPAEHSKLQTPNSKLPYYCPMHPEVTSAEPGRCPKCNMFLVEREG